MNFLSQNCQQHWHPVWMLVYIPAAKRSIQLFTNGRGKAAKNGTSVLGPCDPCGDLDEAPAPAAVNTWGATNTRKTSVFDSPSLSIILNFQMNR